MFVVQEVSSKAFSGCTSPNPARRVDSGVVQKDDEGDGDGGNDPRMFRMKFPANAGPRPCPVEGFSGRAVTQAAMRVNFWHRHVWDTMVILEEVNLPHPGCPLCDILVPWRDINRMHRRTAKFRKGGRV